jgi:NCS2 family nucleobase:cation symporter-2
MTRPPAPRLPADTLYGVGDKPPLATLAVQALQHVGLVAINFIFVLLIMDRAGADFDQRAGALSMAMLMCGLGTWLHAYRLGPLGSGYLLPIVASSIYLGPALMAVDRGGLPLLAGMLVFAGAVELLLARVLPRLRPYFPPEIAGLVIFLVGVTLAVIGLRGLFGLAGDAAGTAGSWSIGIFTLLLMMALQVWGRGVLARAAALLGMLGGCALAWAVAPAAPAPQAAVAILAWPHWGAPGLSFDAALMLPFLLTALASALKAMGTVALAQRLNDAGWVRADVDNVARGVMADGFTTIVGGLLGSPVGANPGSSNSGLVAATGVASRRIAALTGAILVAMAFAPAVSALFLRTPPAVSGAVLLFTACFIMSNGMEMIVSRLLDARKILVIGLSVAAGIGAEVFPEAARHAPGWLAPLLSGSLVCGTVLALLFNGVFRLGVRKTAVLEVDPAGHRPQAMHDFMEHHGALWGARRDVIASCAQSLDQLLDSVLAHCQAQGPLRLKVSFDEFKIVAELDYAGLGLDFPAQRPSLEDIVDSEDGVRRLAGYLLARSADEISTRTRDGRQHIRLRFDH